ncbi:MAG: DUF4296 domain-containing protein [Ignavibacteria bacterium]|nr:DUF4296 domain-containing protein [Ignavibacteria bacterium]
MKPLNKNLFIFFFLFIPSIFIFNCADGKKIDQDKLVLIYTDLLIAQDTASLDDKSVDSLRQAVLQKYNVTEKEYVNTIAYYNEDLKRWEEFFDKVTAHIENLSQSR